VIMSTRANLPELFDGIAASLAANVLPHVSDHYARTQLRAACELLANLGRRVEWRRADADAQADLLRATIQSPALAALRARHMTDSSSSADGDGAALSAQFGALIDLLYGDEIPERQRHDALTEIWKVVRAQFDAEAERIRTGMFS